MTDKPDDKGPVKVDETKRKAEIAVEYETLLSQDQDVISIGKALCSKYGLEQAELDEIVAEARKNPPKRASEPSKASKD